MTRRIDEHVHHDSTDDQYETRHREWPKSLAEKDAADLRRERNQEIREERARNRVSA